MAFIYLIIGVLTGLLAILFGFGGGFVVVPMLVWLLPLQGLAPDLVMHLAIGTSLMLIFITMSYASYIHYRKKNIDLFLLKRLLPWLSLGSITGASLANFLPAFFLKIAFISLLAVLIFLSFKQEFYKQATPIIKKMTPSKLGRIGFLTGTIAALLGIGGSVIIIPFFRRYHLPMLKASALANILAIPSGMIGSIIFLISGLKEAHLPPYSTGYIYWPAVITIFLGSIAGTKLGSYLSTRLPDKFFGQLYPLLLLTVLIILLLK